MLQPQRFKLQSLLAVLVFNGGLLAASYLTFGEVLQSEAFRVTAPAAAVTASLLLWLSLIMLAKEFERDEADEQDEVAMPSQPSQLQAIQILALLQREGRFIDFLHEDLTGHEDAQIGAAVRGIHDGCKKAISDYVEIEPVFSDSEGSTVTVNTGFDANEVRLTGNVSGEPPFRGTLQHKGWRVRKIDLPRKQNLSAGNEMILAAAEVEVGG